MDIEGNVSTKKLNYIKNNVKYIFVDEISMINKEMWRRLVFIKRATGCAFLLIGDDKQLPPVEDEEIEDYFNTSAVKYLCNNNRNILTVMKRFNPQLKEHLNNVEAVDISQFPFKENPINIAYTHKTRKTVNKKWNNKLKPDDCLHIPVRPDDEKYGQDMYIYKGCPLIARQNDNKFQMYMNNETFEVIDYDEDKIYLWTERLNDKGELEVHTIDVDISMVQKLFYLNYCTTIHKVQGTTITESFTIWDWNHPCMSKKAKYTALSRGTCPENISIVGEYGTDDFNESKLRQKLTSYVKSDTDKGLDNDLTVDKVKTLIQKQNGACNICGCDLKMFYKANDREQFSVDRIDSRIGHTCSNVQVLCWGCNSSKGARF
jgi:ATP-dependent exoDNAse (exonuclease V) alpha subunit